MDNRTFYYARVSSKDQNLDRQLAAFKALGANERDIITDKESGKDFNRAGYQALKNGMLRQGDTLVIKSLDRLSPAAGAQYKNLHFAVSSQSDMVFLLLKENLFSFPRMMRPIFERCMNTTTAAMPSAIAVSTGSR